ncbi:hypothetical protein COO60DRAFT_1567433, partial [Scenedesmus sp. NREL 46B-D3]
PPQTSTAQQTARRQSPRHGCNCLWAVGHVAADHAMQRGRAITDTSYHVLFTKRSFMVTTESTYYIKRPCSCSQPRQQRFQRWLSVGTVTPPHQLTATQRMLPTPPSRATTQLAKPAAAGTQACLAGLAAPSLVECIGVAPVGVLAGQQPRHLQRHAPLPPQALRQRHHVRLAHAEAVALHHDARRQPARHRVPQVAQGQVRAARQHQRVQRPHLAL